MGKILWLASYPKSGNTWLRLFLHNFFANLNRPLSLEEVSSRSLSDANIHWYRRFDSRPWQEWSKEDVTKLRARVHAAMMELEPGTLFVKTHNGMYEDFGIPLITMAATAGAIYVVRNPLDVAISHSHHYGQGLEASIRAMNTPGLGGENTATHVYEHHGRWSDHVLSWTQRPHRTLHVIRYEDMLESPAQTFAGVLRFLGLPQDRDRLQRAIRFSSFRVLREQEKRSGFSERPKEADAPFFREGKSGQWKKILTPQQVEEIVSAHREQMLRFGYWPAAGSPASASERPEFDSQSG